MSEKDTKRPGPRRKIAKGSLYLAGTAMGTLFIGAAFAQSLLTADVPQVDIPAEVTQATGAPVSGETRDFNQEPAMPAAATAGGTDPAEAASLPASEPAPADTAGTDEDPGLAALRRLAERVDEAEAGAKADLEAKKGSSAERSLPEEMDPITAREVKRLDREGVLDRQRRVGEDILVMEHEITRAEQITKLIETLGHDGFREAFPDVYESLEESPLVLSSKIKYHELQHELLAAIEGPKEEEEAADVSELGAPRDDGSSFFQLPGQSGPAMTQALTPVPAATPAPVAIAEALLPAPNPSAVLLDEPAGGPAEGNDPALADADMPQPYESISLREVYGLGTDYQAIITLGDERVRVFTGDLLPDGTKIHAIEKDAVVIIRDEEEVRLGIRG